MASSPIVPSAELRYYTVRSRLFRMCYGDKKTEKKAEAYVRQMDPRAVEWWMSRYKQLSACISCRIMQEEHDLERKVDKLRDGLEFGFDVKVEVNVDMAWSWFRDEYKPREVWKWHEYCELR